MHDLATLSALQERLRLATGPDRELDAVLGFEIGGASRGLLSPTEIWIHDDRGFDYLPHYTASVDAALALVEKLGWCPHMMHFGPKGASGWTCVDLCPPNHADEAVDGEGNTAPLAILSALLAALIAASLEGEVFDSCGCVFCDLDLPPTSINGRMVHLRKGEQIACTNPRPKCREDRP